MIHDQSRRITCDDHSRYTAGCRGCQHRAAARGRARTRGLAYGTWEGIVDAAPARRHIAELTAAGWTGRGIGAAASVSRSVIHRLRAGVVTQIHSQTLKAILAVPVSRRHPTGHDVVNAIGAARRLQALTAIGHPVAKLASELGVDVQSVRRWRQQRFPHIITPRHRAIAALYERLATVPGACERSRAYAARRGWAGPMAWDDDTIDDPEAQPQFGSEEPTDPDAYDPITVGLAVDGRLTHAQIAGHRPDLVETVRRLATRMTDQQIADHLRWPGADDGPIGRTRGQNAVNQLRNREGIPAMPKPALAVPHPSTRIRRDRRARQAA
ncbi:hypothetical protein [Micromonospora sp. C41]|uniref:hypothetical protein n=1 Tax=Micromonospora sp. C41 TaxID=2824878 RepID=UPI001B379E2D|nr:hypothetical protein [Micromonospora sp. C41]MBQ1064502.1 hypothetical protein [Micromonospora sp. C41]